VRRNVEIKARIESVDALLAKAASLADSGPVTLQQEDTFFHCAKGRMKLRKLSDEQGELIFYQRPDEVGPKESCYVLAPSASPDALHEALALACGVIGQVRKTRILFMAGRTRIHLDRVESLGDFLELEVVLADNEPAEVGMKEAREILQKLGVSAEHLVSGAYVDLLAVDCRKG